MTEIPTPKILSAWTIVQQLPRFIDRVYNADRLRGAIG